jgi:hypothetical protein
VRRRPLSILAALAAVGALAGPVVAQGDRIVPGRSIGPIAVDDERGTVVSRGLGVGVVIARTPNPQAPGNRNFDAVTVAYPRLALVVRFGTDEASAGALRVSTRSGRYRTAGGLGVGSTRGAVLALHPRAVCGRALCRVGPRAGGRRVTRYHLAGRRVVRVDVLRRP